jgi:protein-disulfide isomerase
MNKSQQKAEIRQQRQIQQKKKQRATRTIVWTVAILFAAVLVFAIVYKPKAAPIAIDYAKLPTIGTAGAPVKIAEFGDFKCSTCKYFSQQIMPQIEKDFVDTGKASVSFLNYTIIGPDSYTAALAGQAVYHQNNDAFWKFYDAVYKSQGDERAEWATSDFLTTLAKQQNLPIDYDLMKKDIDNGTYKNEVDQQNKIANDNKFTGTPTILINGHRIDDKTALDYNNLKAAIEKAYNDSKK